MEEKMKDVIALILLAVIVMFYLFVPYYDYSERAIAKAKLLEMNAEKSPMSVVDVRQPFYYPFLMVMFKLARTVSEGCTAMGFLKFLNTLIGLLTLICFYVFMRLVSKKPEISIFATAFLALSFVSWYSVKSADSNVFVLLLVTLFLMFLFKLHQGIPSVVFHLIIGFLLGIVLLFDVTAVLLIVPVFFFNPYGREAQAVWKLVALVMALGVLALGLYIHFWTTDIQHIDDYGSFLIEQLQIDFLSGKDVPIFNLTPLAALAPFVLTAGGIIGGAGAVSIIIKILIGLAIIALLVLSIVKWEYLEEPDKELINFSFTWFIPMLIFYALWKASVMINSILWLPPIAIILAVTIFSGKWVTVNRLGMIFGAVIIALLLFGNMALIIFPNSSIASNTELYRAEIIDEYMLEDDTLLFFEANEESMKEKFFTYYMPFETDKKMFIIDWRPQYRRPTETLKSEVIKTQRTGSVYLLVRKDMPGGMSVEEFESEFSPLYLSAATRLDENAALYIVN